MLALCRNASYANIAISCRDQLPSSSAICSTTALLVVVSGGAASAPPVPAAFVSLVAAMPAHAAGAGAELVRPSTSAVQSAVEKAPTFLESTSIDQAVNSVVDVVKVVAKQKVFALPQACTCQLVLT